MIGTILAFTQWSTAGFGSLNPRGTIRVVLVSATLISIGTIITFAGFVTSLLTLRHTRPLGSGTEQRDPDDELIAI